MLRLLVLVLFCFGLQAQNISSYYAQRSVSSTVNRITLRQPASDGRALALKGVYATSSVACTLTVSKGGTVTGGSAGTIQALDERGRTAVESVVLDGTVASDTDVIAVSIAAGGERTLTGVTENDRRLNGDGLYLVWDGTNRDQITVEISCGSSGTLYLYLEWWTEGR